MIWDEGELPFQVGGSPYPHATRLLVARSYGMSVEGVDSEVYKIKKFGQEVDDNPITLHRNPNTENDPRGIVYVVLAVALPDTVLWPAHDDYLKTPTMEAAASALLEYLKTLNKNGKLRRCVAEIAMGVDTVRYSFVGDKFSCESSSLTIPQLTCNETEHINGFKITLEKYRPHQLYESESHFQAIK